MSILLSDFLYFFIDFTILLWYYFFIGGRLMAASDESIKKIFRGTLLNTEN